MSRKRSSSFAWGTNSAAGTSTTSISISREPVFECHPSVASFIDTAAKQLYKHGASLGWFMDPTGHYYSSVQPLQLIGAKGCRDSRQIYARVEITDDSLTILKIGRTNNINQTIAIRYNTLPPGQKIVIISPCMLYDLEMERHTTYAVRQVCESIVGAGDDCPRPLKIVYDMTLNDGYHLGLKTAVAHQILECGAQEHHDVRSPAELGMYDKGLEKDCYDLVDKIFSRMLRSISDFLATHGKDLNRIKKNATAMSLQAWPPNLTKGSNIIVVTPLIMETVLELDFWMDQFAKPATTVVKSSEDPDSESADDDSFVSIDDGSSNESDSDCRSPYKHDYSVKDKKQALGRTRIVLDNIGQGRDLNALISKLEAAGEVEGIYKIKSRYLHSTSPTGDTSNTPSFTILMVNTNRELNHDHTAEFASRGLTKIDETHDIEQGTLQLWMRPDCLIIYHSPLYRVACSAMKVRGSDHQTKESVRRSISVMAEVIRRLVFTIRGMSFDDGPNFIEAYFVRLLVSKGFHVGEMIGTAAWKQYFMNYYADGMDPSNKVNCFRQNNLNKTSADVEFSYPSFRRGRRAVNYGKDVADVEDDKDRKPSAESAKVVDQATFIRGAMLLTQVDAEPDSPQERLAFDDIRSLLTDGVNDKNSRITGFVEKLDGDVAERFLAFTREGKSHGNPTAAGATNKTKDINNLIAEAIYSQVSIGSKEKKRCWVHAEKYPKNKITKFRSNLAKPCPSDILEDGEAEGVTYPRFEIAYEALKSKCRKSKPAQTNKTSHAKTSRPPAGMSVTKELIGGATYVHEGWMLMKVFWDT